MHDLLRPRPSNVEIRADDPTLTGHAGLLLTGELASRTDLVAQLDRAIDQVRPFKQRRRGNSGGELLVSLAEMLAVGGDHLSHLEERRADQAAAALRTVAEVPAPTTAGQLLRRFSRRQCEAAVAAMAELGNEVDRQLGLPAGAPVTLDMDSGDSEVYGRHKQGAAYNYQGQLTYDSQLATWAERRRVLAVELRSGNMTEHPTAIRLLRRALPTLPPGHGPVQSRLDSGFYDVSLMCEMRRQDVQFAISVPRSKAMWDARWRIGKKDWRPAIEMRGAEVAETTYRPKGWPHEPLRLLVRRVRVPVEELSQDPRSRRRRTISKEQLKLALGGRVEYVYAYSFILTDKEGDAAEVELWHRQRGGQMEERVKEVKLGCGLRHFPLGDLDGNRAWQAAGVIAHNLISLLSAVAAQANHRQLLAELDESPEPKPRPRQAWVGNHNAQVVRRWLLAVPGRVLHSGRRTILRLPQGLRSSCTFTATYHRLRLLTSAA